MTPLQAFIIVMGLVGQVLIARKDARGYLAWIAGNIALMVVYHQTQQLALIGLQILNCGIQVAALTNWMRERRDSRRGTGIVSGVGTSLGERR